MNTNDALHEPLIAAATSEAREFEKAILQTAIIYRVAQYREERRNRRKAKSGDGAETGVTTELEGKAATYKSLLFALIDELLADHGKAKVKAPRKGRAARSFSARAERLLDSRLAVHGH